LSAHHEMVHTGTTETGALEWSCTQCSRRLLFRWPPNYEKVVLDRGDESASHAGGMGGLRVTADVQAPAPESPTQDERDWLATNGITWNQRPPA
jgi:hypothetical protein